MADPIPHFVALTGPHMQAVSRHMSFSEALEHIEQTQGLDHEQVWLQGEPLETAVHHLRPLASGRQRPVGWIMHRTRYQNSISRGDF